MSKCKFQVLFIALAIFCSCLQSVAIGNGLRDHNEGTRDLCISLLNKTQTPLENEAHGFRIEVREHLVHLSMTRKFCQNFREH